MLGCVLVVVVCMVLVLSRLMGSSVYCVNVGLVGWGVLGVIVF